MIIREKLIFFNLFTKYQVDPFKFDNWLVSSIALRIYNISLPFRLSLSRSDISIIDSSVHSSFSIISFLEFFHLFRFYIQKNWYFKFDNWLVPLIVLRISLFQADIFIIDSLLSLPLSFHQMKILRSRERLSQIFCTHGLSDAFKGLSTR